ncbi:MAG: hypothetical protein WCB49_12650 [Gammaproteobacteria bacterium]
MRRLFVVGGILLALLVAAHYTRWQWAGPVSHSRADRSAIQNGPKTCGTVAEIYHDTHDDGHPTFVDLGHDYPNQTFTIVIWGNDLPRFNPPPESWQDKRLCVTGRIKLYRGTPEVIAYGPDQIREPSN